jgi:flagellar biosynthetic protein FlhB
LAIFTVLRVAMPYIYRYSCNLITRFFNYAKTNNMLDSNFVQDINRQTWLDILVLSAPVMLTSVAVAVLITGAQTKFKFSGEKIKFKFSNISLTQGFKRLFSLRSVIEVLKAIIKTALIGYLFYTKITDMCAHCSRLMGESVLRATANVLDDIFDLVIQMSLIFIGIAAADYLYQRWDYERNIKMTKQELKEEFKETEGNPETKSRIRQVQRSLSRKRMMQQVPTADVVVRNPTHFAVALRYNPEKDEAPVVVAKGQDRIAFKIIEIAEQYHIPMKEDKPLARALYAAVKVDEQIPPEFYAPLASIMAWVFQLRKKEMKR